MKILEKYDHEKREVTLLINCLLGLLFIPKEWLYDKIDEKSLDDLLTEWGVKISIIGGTCDDLKSLVARMRHSAAHFDLDFTADNKRNIESVRFKQQERKRRLPKPNFDVEVGVTRP